MSHNWQMSQKPLNLDTNFEKLDSCVLLFPCLRSNTAFPVSFVWYLPECFGSIIVMKWHQDCWSCSFLLAPMSELIRNCSSAFSVPKCWSWTDVNVSFYVDSTLNVLDARMAYIAQRNWVEFQKHFYVSVKQFQYRHQHH